MRRTSVNLSDIPKADAIFVFAGRDERKRLGLELFQSGCAPRLVLSVARFEWRRFHEIGLGDDGGLAARVATVPAAKRHFFVRVDARGATCEPVTKGYLGTWSEARGFAELVEDEALCSILVVSSQEHLPRCLLALHATTAGLCRLIPVATDTPREPLLQEGLKLFGYALVAPPAFFALRARKVGRRACASK